ncbi:MAG TPA: gliding motility lipoprotein GldH [Phaeodactylibacter sp.]|nr:gliding motility lipoprotein GldH [Phaeodactylibacter sp.]
MQLARLVFPTAILLLALSACGPNYVYEKSYKIEDGAWAYADTLPFQFEIEDTNTIYNLWLEVDHSTDFGNQNLYTQIHTQFPSGQRLTELLSLELANKAGQWFGDCNSESCTLRIPIQQGAYFDQAGPYQITLEQYMRRNPVEGVGAITFRLEATGEQRQ